MKVAFDERDGDSMKKEDGRGRKGGGEVAREHKSPPQAGDYE